MMENVRKISKKYYFRQVMACWMVSLMLFGIPAKVVLATPNGGVVSPDAGGANITYNTGAGNNTTQVDVLSGQTIIDWGGLDTSLSETLAFTQGELSNSAVLNRVTSGIATQFDGALTAADMRIFIVNPAGLSFGPTAYVTARNFVGSAMNMTNADFLAATGATPGNMNFSGSGDLLNEGTISAEAVYLVGENVTNTGSISGEVVVLAAGDQVVIGQPGSDVFVQVTMDAGTDPAERVVDTDDTDGDGIEASHVVLAAGDIWAAALDVQTLRAEAKRDVVIDGSIYAYSEGHSDAVATVEIDAGRDVTVNDRIYAETEIDSGKPEDNAISTIEISAGRDVLINADAGGFTVYAYAEADDSGDAIANVKIDAGGSVVIDDSELEAAANTDWSGNAISSTHINAGGDVIVENDSEVCTEAETDNGAGDATVDSQVNAGGNVIVREDDSEICGYAGTYSDSGDAIVNVSVDADGDVIVENDTEIRFYAYTSDAGDATVGLTVKADNVTVADNSDIKADAQASDGSGNAKATVDIDAAGDVIADGYGEDERGTIESYAETGDSGDAVARTTVTAGNVTVTNDGKIKAEAEASYSGDATATVDVEAEGDVIVGDESQIYASAGVYTEGIIPDYDSELPFVIGSVVQQAEPIPSVADTLDATADVTITADGEVIVDEYGQIYAEAWVNVEQMYYGGPTVTLLAQGDGGYGGDEVLSVPGDATANVTILADDGVTVGIDGEIWADAWIEENYYEGWPSAAYSSVLDGGPSPDGELYSQNASASVDIQTCGDVIVDGQIAAYADVDTDGYWDEGGSWGNATADVSIKAYGDVIVNQQDRGYIPDGEYILDGYGPEGRIEAWASGGNENSADIEILANGDVIVNDGYGYYRYAVKAFFDSEFEGGYGYEINANAENGITNTATVHIATRNDLIVNGQIRSGAQEAEYNAANIGIWAGRDVIVNGGYMMYGEGIDSEQGGQILAEARYGSENNADIDIFADRDVVVNGADVYAIDEPSVVKFYGLSSEEEEEAYPGGQIVAQADSGEENTANIGIVAGRDVTLNSAFAGEVSVVGPGGGQIRATADGEENNANIDICAQDDVTIDGEVLAEAYQAEIRIAAGDEVTGTDGVLAAGADSISILVTDESLVNLDEMFSVYPEIGSEGFEIVEGTVDCPECDFEIDWSWCEDCEEGEPIPEPAPLPVIEALGFEKVTFAEGGCPALMVWLSDEVGVPAEDIQIFIANTFALSTDTQPCEVCARLKNAADILDDDAMTAALTQVVNEFITTPAPPSEEQMASIATAFAGHAGDGTYYAAAGEWIDALVTYVSIMTDEMGWSAGDSVAMLLAKHGLPEGTDATVVAYVQSQLAAIGG